MEKSEYDYSDLTGPLKYKLTNDYMFKAFLQKNESILKGLLCALLRLDYEDVRSVEITNPIVLGETIIDKYVILDIKVLMNDDTIINIEMQVENLGDWPERSLTYLCKNFDHLKRGENYKDTRKVVQIGILDFTPEGFPRELYLDYYFVNKKTNHIYSDKLTILMLQLNQLGNPNDEKSMPELYAYAQLFRAETWEEIAMLADKNESIKECIVTLRELSEDEKIQMECEARERNRRDMIAAEAYGHKKGMEQGLQEGLQQGLQQGISNFVSSLVELNISKSQIIEKLVEKYGLTVEEATRRVNECVSGNSV